MGVMAHSPPNYAISVLGSAGGLVDPTTITPDSAGVYPPIVHYNKLPDPNSLIGSINGLLSGVFAYGGAQLFVEFMAEMRRPRDFLWAMWAAQIFIWAVYLIYGCYVYYYQGQYSYQISYQGLSLYWAQATCDLLVVITGLIAAGLYGNIGIKVMYNNVLMDLLNAPPLISKPGKIIYACIVPVWWTIAYIISAGIPDYFGFVSTVSAATVLQFTYAFPPMLALGYDIRLSAMKRAVGDGEGFDSRTGEVIRRESGVKYWVRGFFSGGPLQVATNVWHVVYALGSWVMAGLGMYAAIQGTSLCAFESP